jgi:hypothetical protein
MSSEPARGLARRSIRREGMPRVAVESNRRQTGRSASHAALFTKGGMHLCIMSMWQWESTKGRLGSVTVHVPEGRGIQQRGFLHEIPCCRRPGTATATRAQVQLGVEPERRHAPSLPTTSAVLASFHRSPPEDEEGRNHRRLRTDTGPDPEGPRRDAGRGAQAGRRAPGTRQDRQPAVDAEQRPPLLQGVRCAGRPRST